MLARDPVAHVSLDSPFSVARLLEALRLAGARSAVTALLARDPVAHVNLRDPRGVAELLEALRFAWAGGAVTALAGRAADAGMFDLFLKACPGEASGYKFGREPDGTPSRSWQWQAPDHDVTPHEA